MQVFKISELQTKRKGKWCIISSTAKQKGFIYSKSHFAVDSKVYVARKENRANGNYACDVKDLQEVCKRSLNFIKTREMFRLFVARYELDRFYDKKIIEKTAMRFPESRNK